MYSETRSSVPHESSSLSAFYCNDKINFYGTILRSSRPEVFLEKGVLKIWSKFTGEHSCRSTISIKLQSNFTEIALQHGCSPVNLLHIFKTPFSRNTSDSHFCIHFEFYHFYFFVGIMCSMNWSTCDEQMGNFGFYTTCM